LDPEQRPRLRLITPDPDSTPPPAAEGPIAPPVDLETAFKAYGRYVAFIGMRILGRRDDVDDLVQDVFLDAVRGLDKLRDPNAAKGWLATLTVRKAHRALRRRRLRWHFGLDEGADYGEIVDPSASAAERAMIADLYRLLDGVPAEARIAWSLRHLEGEPLEKVASLCGCSLATAKRRIAAAHQVLSAELADG
jgi:RNA polymerase sigma-70 factor (ECF subfamily)